MSIEYFDFENNLTERSVKNMPRPFRPYEAFYVKESVRHQNTDFKLADAKDALNSEIKSKRIERFKKETDRLLLEIQAAQLLGKNAQVKINEFILKYEKILEELDLK